MKKSVRFMLWLPRILCILFILFVSIFALDSFGPGPTIRQQVAAFIGHLIPTFILIGLLIIAWKWQLAGGIIFSLLALGLSPLIYLLNHNRNELPVNISINMVLLAAIPLLVTGILFIISHFIKKTAK